MSDANSYAQAYSDAFSKFVPGFDFLQGLVKNAGQTLPSMGQWIAPVLDPAELDRRIAELRTVQFWLEQNARMISATIQAMEVQRMTLSALQGMNVSMGDLSEALKIRVPDVFGAAASAAAASAAPAPAPAPAPAAAEAPAGAPAVDPMQWWGALTQQFTQLASQAMQATSEAASQATQAMQAAGAAATDAAAEAMAQATPMAAAAVDSVKAAAEAVVQAVPMPSVAKAAATAPAAPAPKAAPRKSATKAAGKAAAAPAKKTARKSAS